MTKGDIEIVLASEYSDEKNKIETIYLIFYILEPH